MMNMQRTNCTRVQNSISALLTSIKLAASQNLRTLAGGHRKSCLPDIMAVAAELRFDAQ